MLFFLIRTVNCQSFYYIGSIIHSATSVARCFRYGKPIPFISTIHKFVMRIFTYKIKSDAFQICYVALIDRFST